MLNPDDESHMWCLHFVFIPIINRHLNNWRAAYVQHSLRTEHNKTPMQLWISGLSEARGSFRAEDLYFQVELQSFDFGETLVCRHRIAFTQPLIGSTLSLIAWYFAAMQASIFPRILKY